MDNQNESLMESTPNNDNAALIALYQGLNELLSTHDARVVAALEILNAKIDSVESEIYRQAAIHTQNENEVIAAIEDNQEAIIELIEKEEEEEEEESAEIETVIIQEAPAIDSGVDEEKAPRKRYFI